MVLSESILVVVACTLAGGFDRQKIMSDVNITGSCGMGTRFPECLVLDEHEIVPLHLVVPWVVTLGALVILGMPTLLLRSKSKEKGLRTLAGNFFQCLGLLVCSSLTTDHPSIAFALTLHSCTRLLLQMEITDSLVGGANWWRMRYIAVVALLSLEVSVGPALSIVRWPNSPPNSLTCAYLAHLAGCILPDLVLDTIRTLIATARYVHIRED
jgi:hypothetical protein